MKFSEKNKDDVDDCSKSAVKLKHLAIQNEIK